MSDIISTNRKVWNAVYTSFTNACALPIWGPFDVGDDLNLIPEIKGKTFLEIGCGSGRSIKYLLERGAEMVYGLDFSERQLEVSSDFNKDYVEAGLVELIHSAMEEEIDIPQVDTVFSIYGIGWSTNPQKTFSNIFKYLKPGGYFIWSWDHLIFHDIELQGDVLVVNDSYHEEPNVIFKNWKEGGQDAHLTFRKTSTWIKLLREAGFNLDSYHEPAPNTLHVGHEDDEKYYSAKKAQMLPITSIFVCHKN